MKKEKKRMSKISIIVISIILVILIVVIFNSMSKQGKPSSKKKVNEISSPKDFKDVSEAIEYTGSKMISRDRNNIYVTFKYPTYTSNMSNQKYYMNLISYVAETLNFESFNLIDKEQNIEITVTCDKSLKQITDYLINGEGNYFGKNDSKIAIESYTQVPEISLNIQSDVIKKTINKNWKYNDINYGTMESQFEERRIYFDEGYDVRVIENDHMQTKVLNIVFNSRYNGNVLNNISTKNTIEDVKNILGEPAFSYGDNILIGYKSKDIYVFFVKNYDAIEISIYSNEQYNTDGFANAVTQFISNKKYNKLIDNVFDNWQDTFKVVANADSDASEYPTKGVKIEFNSTNPSGVTLYNNFKGKITNDITIEQVIKKEKNLPENVYFVNEDSIYLCERERNSRYYFDENLTESNELFYVLPVDMDGALTYRFVSIDNSNPDFEIIDNVRSFMWIDKTHFVYGVSNKGIFMIDVLTRKQTDVVRGTATYNITKYEDGVLYYDESQANINF